MNKCIKKLLTKELPNYQLHTDMYLVSDKDTFNIWGVLTNLYLEAGYNGEWFKRGGFWWVRLPGGVEHCQYMPDAVCNWANMSTDEVYAIEEVAKGKRYGDIVIYPPATMKELIAWINKYL